MKRIVILALVVLAGVAGPAQARDDERRFHGKPGRVEHQQHLQRALPHRIHGHVPYRYYSYAPIYSYAPSCSWRQGYWGYQPYLDASGRYYWYVPQWVPAEYVCY